jgi:hypothetical protein
MQKGICRLCHKLADLQESHFFPRAVYIQLREAAFKNPNPVLMTEDESTISQKQIKEYLLCFDCEQRFSRLGESWVMANMARITSFPLQDSLFSVTPLGVRTKRSPVTQQQFYQASIWARSLILLSAYFGAALRISGEI